MARPSLRLFWAAAVALPVVIGDGEIFLSSSSSTSSAPVSSDWTASNVTYDCNPYEGQEFLIFGNGNGITSGSCYASWDLHEIQLWDENGVQIQNLGAVPSPARIMAMKPGKPLMEPRVSFGQATMM